MDNKSINSPKNIVCIGGGTGTFVVLKGLKLYDHRLTAIVTMSDSGGSNRRIRDEFGLLPTSDIRQCFVALSNETGGEGLLRKLFMYRFDKGEGIKGMTFANLFMAALSDILGSQAEAIRKTGEVLRIHGTVIPVTYTKTNLYAEYEDGHIVNEEHFIDEPVHDGTLKIKKLYLQPKPRANPAAVKAIEDADIIVLGPGDLYTSLLPNLIIPDIAKAVSYTKAKKVYILNLMTKYGQTYGYTAQDHVKTVEKYIGQTLQYVINNNAKFPDDVLAKYEKMKEFPIVDDLPGNMYYTVIRRNIIGKGDVKKATSDALVRSLIRHDSNKLAKVLLSIL